MLLASKHRVEGNVDLLSTLSLSFADCFSFFSPGVPPALDPVLARWIAGDAGREGEGKLAEGIKSFRTNRHRMWHRSFAPFHGEH